MRLFDRKLYDESKEIKEKLKKKNDIEKLLKETEAEFSWNEEAFKEKIGQDVYGKVCEIVKYFSDIIENKENELPSDTIINPLLDVAFMKVMEDLDSEITNPETSVKRKKQLMTFAKGKDWLGCSCKCYKRYLKKRWLNAHEIYRKNMHLVFKYSVSLEDILAGDVGLPEEIKQQIDQADEFFWNCDCKVEFKGVSLEDKNKNKYFFEEVVKNKKIWECFSNDTIYELCNREIEELLRENMNSGEVWRYRDFDIKHGENMWENEYLKKAYGKCLAKVGKELIWDDRINYNCTVFREQHSYDISIKREIEKVCYDEKKSDKIIQTKIKRIFKENADLEDALDFPKLVFAGILCELRYQTESHCNTSNKLHKLKKLNLEFAYDDEMIWVYEKQSNRLLTKMKMREYRKMALGADEDSNEECDIKNLGIYYSEEIGHKIKDDLDFMFQARQILDGEINAVINGKGKSRHFSYCFEKIFGLKDGLTLYESYIVEKQSGFYLTWMIYSRTVRMRFIKNPKIKDKIKKLTEELSKIKNADIRLVMADHILDVLDEILCMEGIDIIQGMDAICREVGSCVEHFNEKYTILYEMMFLIFVEEKRLSNGKCRYQLLAWNEFTLSDTFMNMECNGVRI
ncbi:MAG: hypothetical protein UFJ18_16310 [Blautia sp.]|nr:hypothetical protein [Blautia sp.]